MVWLNKENHSYSYNNITWNSEKFLESLTDHPEKKMAEKNTSLGEMG